MAGRAFDADLLDVLHLLGAATPEDAADFEACRNVLGAFFSLSDARRYELLDRLVSPDFVLEGEPMGLRLEGLDDYIAAAQSGHPGIGFRSHVNTNLVLWRQSDGMIVASATCSYFEIDRDSDSASASLRSVSDVRYTFRRDEDGWRLLHRHVTRLFPGATTT